MSSNHAGVFQLIRLTFYDYFNKLKPNNSNKTNSLEIFKYLISRQFYDILAKLDNRAIPIIEKDQYYSLKIYILNDLLWNIEENGNF